MWRRGLAKERVLRTAFLEDVSSSIVTRTPSITRDYDVFVSMGCGGLLHRLCGVGMIKRASEEQNVRLGVVPLVVLPARRLLHAQCPPFGFCEEARGQLLGQLFW